MKLNYKDIALSYLVNFNGGEKELAANIYNDGQVKILTRAVLIPGASIGLHCHNDSLEVILILSGTGKMICNNIEERLNPMDIHYCKKGECHTLINDSNEDLVFFAVIPKVN